MARTGKVRYAVVGQGWFSQDAVLPAFASARRNSELAALVSGDPEKRRELGEHYGVPAYDYTQYDELMGSDTVDAVYIVLPNDQHADYTVRAARAGVHVLVEKPMANSAAQCQQMIDACREASVKLMVAYRLHFEKANMKAVELLRKGEIGEPRAFVSLNTEDVEEGNIRLDLAKGGGPLRDVGIYCINAARYLFQDDPVEVTAFAASRDDKRFQRVPELVSAILRFPGERLALFTCGVGEAKTSMFQVIGTKGDLRTDPAFTFRGKHRQFVTVEGKTREELFEESDQVGAEIEYFSDCVLQGWEPEPSGLEGLIDLRVIEAVEHALASGHPVPLAPLPSKLRPSGAQVITRPPVESPELVHASAPKG